MIPIQSESCKPRLAVSNGIKPQNLDNPQIAGSHSYQMYSSGRLVKQESPRVQSPARTNPYTNHAAELDIPQRSSVPTKQNESQHLSKISQLSALLRNCDSQPAYPLQPTEAPETGQVNNSIASTTREFYL